VAAREARQRTRAVKPVDARETFAPRLVHARSLASAAAC
jgi:hypothetical protein